MRRRGPGRLRNRIREPPSLSVAQRSRQVQLSVAAVSGCGPRGGAPPSWGRANSLGLGKPVSGETAQTPCTAIIGRWLPQRRVRVARKNVQAILRRRRHQLEGQAPEHDPRGILLSMCAWELPMKAFLLLVTWLASNQPPSHYQVQFSSNEVPSRRRGRIRLLFFGQRPSFFGKRTARLDSGERWPSRLVATAAENRLNMLARVFNADRVRPDDPRT
jgi:hypothetical protein